MLFVALFGACIGSFTNVVAWRLPRGESGASGKSLPPMRSCRSLARQPSRVRVVVARPLPRLRGIVSWRYPVVEAASALLWVSSLAVQSGGACRRRLAWAGVLLVALLLPLVLASDHLWLPEPFCRWGVLLGLLLSAAGGLPLAGHLIAAGVALLVLEQLSALAERILGQPALGLGDAKLAAMGGAWLGLTGITAAMALAVISGALVGSIGRVSGRLQPRQPFPFGPFIALGIWLVWLTGPLWWWEQWQGLLGL